MTSAETENDSVARRIHGMHDVDEGRTGGDITNVMSSSLALRRRGGRAIVDVLIKCINETNNDDGGGGRGGDDMNAAARQRRDLIDVPKERINDLPDLPYHDATTTTTGGGEVYCRGDKHEM